MSLPDQHKAAGMGRVIFFEMRVEPEDRRTVLDALLEHGRLAALDEPGMLRFDVLEDDTDSNRLFLYEAYADQAAFDTHLAGESHKAAAALLQKLREQGRVKRDLLIRMHSASETNAD